LDRFIGVCDTLATFFGQKPVSGLLASASRSEITLLVFVMLARWTLENDQRYDLLETLIQYLLILWRVPHSRRHFSLIICSETVRALKNSRMEQNLMEVIIRTENLINAVQNKPALWHAEMNASEEEKELAWTRVAGALQYSKGKLIYS